MKLRGGNGGWAVFEALDLGLPGRTYVRLTEVDGVDRVTELYVDGRGEPIRPGYFRNFPLAEIEQWLAGFGGGFTARREVAGPDLSRLASYFAHTWGGYRGNCNAPLKGRRSDKGLGDRAIDNWAELAYISQYEATFSEVHVKQPPMGDGRQNSEWDEIEAPEVRLEYKSGQRLTPAFLSDVATAYDAAIARGLAPAETISKLVNVDRKTAQSWIYKARKGGLMPPAKSKGRIV